MSEKTKENLDFEAMDWQYIAFHRFLMPLPSDWVYEMDSNAGKIRAKKSNEVKLTVSPYLVSRENKADLSSSLQMFGKAYEENNFDLCSEIRNAGAFLFQYHSFEGEPLMLIALTEKEYQGQLYHLFFVLRAESQAALLKSMMPLYHIINRTSVELT